VPAIDVSARSNRFEITNLPQLPDHASSHVAQRCRTTKPIGVVKIDSEFLLCYSGQSGSIVQASLPKCDRD